MNTKEKIIICLDLSSELQVQDLKSNDGAQYSRLHHVKRAIKMFVNMKSNINSNHEYALMILQDNASLMEDFIKDPKEFNEKLDYFNQTTDCSIADLNSIFDVIKQSIKLPKYDDNEHEDDFSLETYDDFIIRLIIIYARSSCMPNFTKLDKSFIDIILNPKVFIDVLYLHEIKPNQNINNIYAKLCELDIRGKSYILNTVWRLANIYNEFSQLLGHPLHRVPQNEADYRIPIKVDKKKIENTNITNITNSPSAADKKSENELSKELSLNDNIPIQKKSNPIPISTNNATTTTTTTNSSTSVNSPNQNTRCTINTESLTSSLKDDKIPKNQNESTNQQQQT